MEQLVNDLVQGGAEGSASRLYAYCRAHPEETRGHRELLRDVHAALWEEYSSRLEEMEGEQYCDSVLTFQCCAIAESEPVDSTLAISDFPLLKLQPCWLHEKYKVPVSRFPVTVLLDAMSALEWHLASDVLFTDRTKEWFSQVHGLWRLLWQRACLFCTDEGGLGAEILDDENLRERIGGEEKKEESGGYESDDETFRKRQRVEAEVDFSAYEEVMYLVTSDFAFFADAHLAAIERALFLKRELRPPPFVPSLDAFRNWLFNVKTVALTVERVGKARDDWFNELRATRSRERVFKKRFGGRKLATKRQILLKLNDELLMEPYTSWKQLNGTVRGSAHAQQDLRISTDAVFRYITEQDKSKVFDVLHEKRDAGMCIFRDEALNMWVCQVDTGEYWTCLSFTHAFYQLRLAMRERHLLPIFNKQNLGLYDTELFASALPSPSGGGGGPGNASGNGGIQPGHDHRLSKRPR